MFEPPFLTAGQLTPEALKAWEMSCNQFFLHKDTKDEDKVKKVAWGMQDPLIQDWYLTDQERLEKLTFKEYINEVRSYFLPRGWSDILRRKMLASTQGQRPFSEWAVEVLSQNTPSRHRFAHY